MDHDVVRLMLRSFTVIDPHLVNLIRENPRYTKMTPEEILGKFVSGRMMVKEARYVDNALNGPLPVYEPQPVALKATSSKEAGEFGWICQSFENYILGCQGVFGWHIRPYPFLQNKNVLNSRKT